MPIFMRWWQKRDFFLLKFLHFANYEIYSEEVPPKMYKVRPVFDYMVQKFSENYTSE